MPNRFEDFKPQDQDIVVFTNDKIGIINTGFNDIVLNNKSIPLEDFDINGIYKDLHGQVWMVKDIYRVKCEHIENVYYHSHLNHYEMALVERTLGFEYNYIAQDITGIIWAFYNRPIKNPEGEYWFAAAGETKPPIKLLSKYDRDWQQIGFVSWCDSKPYQISTFIKEEKEKGLWIY